VLWLGTDRAAFRVAAEEGCAWVELQRLLWCGATAAEWWRRSSCGQGVGCCMAGQPSAPWQHGQLQHAASSWVEPVEGLGWAVAPLT
jgi:hypothetical protein